MESSLIGYFPYKEPIRQDSRFIDENFGGTNMFNVLFAAEEGKDLTDPAVLKCMDDMKQFLLKNYPETVGQIISYSDFIKRMNQIMNYPAEGDDGLPPQSGSEDFSAMGTAFSAATLLAKGRLRTDRTASLQAKTPGWTAFSVTICSRRKSPPRPMPM